YPVVGPADDDAKDRVVSGNLIALDDVDFGAQRRHQQGQLVGVVLGVAVRVKDELFGGGLETGLQCSAVAPVHRVGHDPHVVVLGSEVGQHLSGVVGRAVVDHDDLVV